MFIKFDISSCFTTGVDATILADFGGKNEYRTPDWLLVRKGPVRANWLAGYFSLPSAYDDDKRINI